MLLSTRVAFSLYAFFLDLLLTKENVRNFVTFIFVALKSWLPICPI